PSKADTDNAAWKVAQPPAEAPHISEKATQKPQQAAPTTAPAEVEPRKAKPAAEPGVRRVPMSKIRRSIAERLVRARQTTAMLTTFNEVDMTAVQELRARNQEQLKQADGVPLR